MKNEEDLEDLEYQIETERMNKDNIDTACQSQIDNSEDGIVVFSRANTLMNYLTNMLDIKLYTSYSPCDIKANGKPFANKAMPLNIQPLTKEGILEAIREVIEYRSIYDISGLYLYTIYNKDNRTILRFEYDYNEE